RCEHRMTQQAVEQIPAPEQVPTHMVPLYETAPDQDGETCQRRGQHHPTWIDGRQHPGRHRDLRDGSHLNECIPHRYDEDRSHGVEGSGAEVETFATNFAIPKKLCSMLTFRALSVNTDRSLPWRITIDTLPAMSCMTCRMHPSSATISTRLAFISFSSLG